MMINCNHSLQVCQILNAFEIKFKTKQEFKDCTMAADELLFILKQNF